MTLPSRVALSALVVCFICSSSAQSRAELLNKFGSSYIYRLPTEKLSSKWLSQPWIDRSNQYELARKRVESDFQRTKIVPNELFDRFRVAAQREPRNSLLQFRWAYLGSLIAQREAEAGRNYWRKPKHDHLRGQIRWSLALAPNPRNAEYDRLRFIYEAASGPADTFRELGKRLLAKWPNDEAILRNRALNLGNSSRPEDVAAAIATVDRLLARHSEDIRYIGMKGDIYRGAWIRLHRPQDGRATLEWSERYLKVATLDPLTKAALLRANDSIRSALDKHADER